MRRWSNERARVTWGQNFLFRWVPEAHLYGLWKDLQALDMGRPGAGEITDVISCPGTDSCKLGITSSMGLNTAIREKLAQLDIDDAATRRIRIHMSGCPNSCGQHHIANIGFHGAAIKQGRRQIPAYLVYLAGSYKDNDPLRMGTLVPLRLPAKRVPEAVERFLSLYQRERESGEEFNDFFDRVGQDPFLAAAQDLTLPPDFGADTLRCSSIGSARACTCWSAARGSALFNHRGACSGQGGGAPLKPPHVRATVPSDVAGRQGSEMLAETLVTWAGGLPPPTCSRHQARLLQGD